MSADQPSEGIRLAKRVAALQGCSRRQAEALITSGAVQVAGQVLTHPAHRVAEGLPVHVEVGCAQGGMTVLLYKPAGVAAAQALRQAWATLELGPRPGADLKEYWPLPQQASGLSIWSDERAVVRRLLDHAHPLEAEWLLSLPMSSADGWLSSLAQRGIRVSLGHERDGMGHWRLIDKSGQGRHGLDWFDAPATSHAWALHRQRVGRQGVAPLHAGQARLRLDFEKF